MGKILYPVGTPVTVRKYPEVEGLIVTQYLKGEKYPYRVGFHAGDEVTVGTDLGKGKSKFSKAGLKRYNPTQAKVAEASPTVSAPMNCNCYTKEEVDLLLAQQWQDLTELLRNVDHVAMEALQNTQLIAKLTDKNFMSVQKSFKKLSHDDD